MTIGKPDGWLFSGGEDSERAKPGIIALLSHLIPESASDPTKAWLEIDENVDGMACGVLQAYVLPLPVPESRLKEILYATDWVNTPGDRGWRHDLSWHNTPMDEASDPTVQAYLSSIGALGLVWTPAKSGLSRQQYGQRLAQAVYPFDPTDANLKAMGVIGHVAELLGQEVDPERHALVLLTPNDD